MGLERRFLGFEPPPGGQGEPARGPASPDGNGVPAGLPPPIKMKVGAREVTSREGDRASQEYPLAHAACRLCGMIQTL
jgi:hypothetical protein